MQISIIAQIPTFLRRGGEMQLLNPLESFKGVIWVQDAGAAIRFYHRVFVVLTLWRHDGFGEGVPKPGT